MTTFDQALEARLNDEILDRCTLCGKCVEACPMPAPAGFDMAGDGAGARVVTGVIDLLRGGQGSDEGREWTEICTGSGYCIEACPEGVNPRFMLAMAKLEARRGDGKDAIQARARASFGKMSNAVRAFARLQLPPEILARINPASSKDSVPHDSPEVVYYTGCNMLRTPHIGLLCLEVLDAMGVAYDVMGGPGDCCGIFQFRDGDTAASEKISGRTMDRFAETRAPEVLAWCPSCVVQYGEVNFPTFEKSRGRPAPFDMVPFYVWLAGRLDDLEPLMKKNLDRRIALVERPGVPGARDAAIEIAKAIPGVEYVALPDVRRVAITSNYLTLLPDFKDSLLAEEFDACVEAGVDTLATIFHPCHRETCHLGEGKSFEIVNLMELVGESMGIHVPDLFKKLKIMGDVDRIIAECADMIAEHDMDVDALRGHLEAEIIHANPFAGVFSKE
ncbi:MAG: (Fe-S)-binding protein [Alphaproteobacteria bacterium]